MDSLWGTYSYVADYNRWGWGLLAISLVWAINPQARGHLAQLCVGVSLCLLLYLKLTLFVGACLTCGLGLLWDRRPRDYLIPAGMILAAMAIGGDFGLFVPYLADNIDIGRVTGSLRIGKLLLQLLNAYNGVVTLLVIPLALSFSIDARWRLSLVVATLILHLVSLQSGEMMVPLIGLPLLLLAPHLPCDPHLPSGRARWYRPGLAQAPAILQAAGLFCVVALASVAQAKQGQLAEARPISGAMTLGERLLQSTDRGNGPGIGAGDLDYADGAIFDDIGQALVLLKDLPPRTRVATLEFANIAAANWPRTRPAAGGLLWYHYGRSFNEQIFPSPQEIFAGADAILVPLHFTTDGTRHLVATYQGWLDRCTTVMRENDYWRLYRPSNSTATNDAAGNGATASDNSYQLNARARSNVALGDLVAEIRRIFPSR
jgi:hypothetical protein